MPRNVLNVRPFRRSHFYLVRQPAGTGGWVCLAMLMTAWGPSSSLAGAEAVPAGEAQQLIERRVEELRVAVVQDEEGIKRDPNRAMALVDRIVSPTVDTIRIGKLILGKHWQTATPEQRQQFVDGYRKLLLRTYAVHVSDYADVKVAYLPLRSASRERGPVMVRTQVSHGNKPPINVDYRLYQNDGAWKVFDVAADGISLVATFRSSVDAVVQRVGIDGLIADLNAKNQQPIRPRD